MTGIHTLFPTHLTEIQERIKYIDPVKYASTRNFKDGAVTRLSPYISRGVISTKQVFAHILSLDLPWHTIEKFVQELAWRDYWQQVWKAKGEAINHYIKQPQSPVANHGLPTLLAKGNTGIDVIDDGIASLYATGYMHNHLRMYVASIACNIAQSHWRVPAKWMYFHLLDGDWASNALSWQWVAGANAKKKYYANQENINKFFYSDQKGTFLDVSYEALNTMEPPSVLQENVIPVLKTKLSETQPPQIAPNRTTLIYNYYNLDPEWRKEENCNRILLLEPSVFEKYPISAQSLSFALELSKNIEGLQTFVGEFEDLARLTQPSVLIFKEHPLNTHYKGIQDPRDWMFKVEGYFPSFFAFWKKCKKAMRS